MKRNSELFRKASDPSQYDRDEVSWSSEHGLESPTRKFFYDYLLGYKDLWQNASILDIGAGSGWLPFLMKENGAREVLGVEPSKKNAEQAKKMYPSVHIENKSFEEFESTQQFDLIVSVMAFCHIGDLEKAFKKAADLLADKGEMQIVVPDFVYYRKKRKETSVKIEEVDDEEYIASVTRLRGTIVDIIRKSERYIDAAQKFGLRFIGQIPMAPTQDLIKSLPLYEDFKNSAITNLLRFAKG